MWNFINIIVIIIFIVYLIVNTNNDKTNIMLNYKNII